MAFLEDYETTWRYFHILSGITWIGLLYFFNLVNLPLLKFDLNKPYAVDMAQKATPHITLKTLFWFRWGAMFTLIFGLILIEVKRQQFGGLADYFINNGAPGWFILIGVLLAIVMWANVWFIIWPNQKTILGNNKAIADGAPEADKKRMQEENAPRLKSAVLASRFNTWASIPMLFGMVFGAHGGGGDFGDFAVPLTILAVVLLVMIVMSTKKS